MNIGKDFAKAIKQLEKEKGLNAALIVDTLEAALQTAYKKHYGSDENIVVEIGLEDGIVSIYSLKDIVDVVENPHVSLSVEDAKKLGFNDKKIGDAVKIEINPEDFGRIAAQTARQVVIQRIKEAERQIIYDEFSDKIGDIVSGVVFKNEQSYILVSLNRSEGVMTREESIKNEVYSPGKRMHFLLLDVKKTTKGPRILLSRTHPNLLKRLIELEIPEVKEGIIEIKHIVREPGARSKVAVVTRDPDVDPVGACIGGKGSRIKTIMDELNGERIDIIVWDDDPMKFIRNSLSPAKVGKIEPILEEDKAVRVWVAPNQLSLAIGKEGQNVRLAARITGWKIDIKPYEPDRLPTLQDLFVDIMGGEVKHLWEKEDR